MNKETFAKIYISFSVICIVGSFWIDWLIIVFIVSGILGCLVMKIIDDHKKDKRLEYLEEQLAKRGNKK